ncbi:MAG TPA: PVC-type heme-binding CxxCH protein [Isosphaeraceae bacterium]
MQFRPRPQTFLASIVLAISTSVASGQVPHNQDRPPNLARSPEEAARAMTVPPGFAVEVVASEPDLVNPVAMTFDERGRVWVTESLEYPRRSSGKGRDRIKVMEDTDGDGKMDKFTVFAEGLNIPSGIAVGAGGVWVANSPDILFMQDTDADGRADKTEVVVTGFGRDDTHELPNSLTWGPDGYLYGLNGVFNRSVVKQSGKTFEFTCALFRIHPKTRRFELFAEGTSNPWGVAWDNEGSAFVSACVIDHLWHLVETGYYHRQGGPYPPFTWKIESIVDYKHQKAAYCGIHFFDSDAYPPEYREKLYMGNIHGGCINVDAVVRNGSTYKGVKQPDFLTANDAWFMPVVQKTGPDGCLYILDWYDRYHCYQDANRDPEGIDRLKGRLYRVRYKDTPRAPKVDLAKETDNQLIERLRSPNVFYRDLAQRLLRERNDPETIKKLQALVLSDALRKARMHALWAVVGAGPLDPKFHLALLDHDDPVFRAWGVRAAGDMEKQWITSSVAEKALALVRDKNPDVILQVVIAVNKMFEAKKIELFPEALSASGDDPLIPRIVWRNLHPLLDNSTLAGRFADRFTAFPAERHPHVTGIIPLVVEHAIRSAHPQYDLATILILHLLKTADKNEGVAEAARESLATLAEEAERATPRPGTVALFNRLRPWVDSKLSGPANDPFRFDAVLIGCAFRDTASLRAGREVFLLDRLPDDKRLRLLDALMADGDDSILDPIEAGFVEKKTTADFRSKVLAALDRLDSPKVAEVVLRNFPAMEPELKPKAIELLTQRSAWSKALLGAIEAKSIPKDALNTNQVRKLLASKDAGLARSVKAIWGTIREGRNPQREAVMGQLRNILRNNPGNPNAGAVVFKNLCAQCHKIYGEGQEVGPDLTSNGRASFEQLLSNALDPSLVIGEAYQATTIATTDGRVLTGLRAEDTPQRVVLRLQGGKLEAVPRDAIDEMKISPLSMMPEDLEKQLKPQEIVDLFAFLVLDKPPTDPSARRIPGTPEGLVKPGESAGR